MATITTTYLSVEPIIGANKSASVAYGGATGLYQNTHQVTQTGQTGAEVTYTGTVTYNATDDADWATISTVEQGTSATPRFKQTISANAYTGTKGIINKGSSALSITTSGTPSNAGFSITYKATTANINAAITTLKDKVSPNSSGRTVNMSTYFFWPGDAREMDGTSLANTKSEYSTQTSIKQNAGSAYDMPYISVTVTAKIGTTQVDSGTISFVPSSYTTEKSSTLSIGSNLGNYGTTYSYSLSATSVSKGDTITGSITSGLAVNSTSARTISVSASISAGGDYTGTGAPTVSVSTASFSQPGHTPASASASWTTTDPNSTVSGATLTAGTLNFQSHVNSLSDITKSISTNVGTFTVTPTMKTKTTQAGPYLFCPTYSQGSATATGDGKFYHNYGDDPNGNNYCVYYWTVTKKNTSASDLEYTVSGTSSATCTITITTQSGTVTGVSLEDISNKSWTHSEYTSSGTGKTVSAVGSLTTSGATSDRGGKGVFDVSVTCYGSDGTTTSKTYSGAEITRQDTVAGGSGTYSWSISNSAWSLSATTGSSITVTCPAHGGTISKDICLNGSSATLTCTFTSGTYTATKTATMSLAAATWTAKIK